MKNCLGLASWVGMIVGFLASPAVSVGSADFYDGKTVRFVVGSAPGGGYDTYTRMIARHIPDNEVVIFSEAGHSPYWEQPEAFNRTVLDFIGRH